MNYLKAVFWDYPRLTDPEYLHDFIKKNRDSARVYRWLLRRFLENGRVVDTFQYFPLTEIAAHISKLRLSPYSKKKWTRIIEFYGSS